MKIKKVLSLFLATVMATSCFSGAFAESATTSVTASIPAAVFSVTVPTVLPCAFNMDGSMQPPPEAKITNNSPWAIKVTNISQEGKNGWGFHIGNVMDKSQFSWDDKEYNLWINEIFFDPTNPEVDDSETHQIINSFGAIEPGQSKDLNYRFAIVPQTTALDNVEIAAVTLTFDWAD